MNYFIVSVSILLGLSTLISAWEKRNDAHGKTIIAYYASWQWYDRSGLAKPSNLDHSKVTRYTFAFFQINEQGDIWGTDNWADPNVLFGLYDWNWVEGNANTYCSWDAPDEPPVCAGHKAETGLIYQAHSAGVEVYPSIGGWTLSDPFSKLAESPEARRNFAANCVKLIIAYDFDGIDIDWEYPGYAPHLGRDMDTINYNLFLKEIRDALDELGHQTGRFYGLTAALPCGPTIIDNIQIDVVNDLLTEFNLMTYDFHGSWNPTTGVNAPLYDQDGSESENFSVHACVQTWMEGGARPEQINIGLPFYGRSFAGTGLTGIGQSHSGDADLVAWSLDEGSPQFFNIMEKISGFTSVRDEQTKTQLAYNYAGFLSYDDERAICDKCEYAVDHGLNGYIIWEISGDLMPDLSQPLLQACNDRINDLSKRCDDSEMLRNWYAHPDTEGACVQDGNQATPFITHENMYSYQMFVSAEACCDAIYSSKPDCLTTSLDPSAADWHESMEVDPWYAHPGMQVVCVQDGNQATHFITDENMYSSAKECCDANYSFVNTCLDVSLNPGIDGRWHESMEGDPFYPHSKGYCLDDGNHEESFIDLDQMFVSAQACCDATYSYKSDCLTTSLDPPAPDWHESMEGDPWYARPGMQGVCVQDGNQATHFIPDDYMYSSAKQCCDAKYFYVDTCLDTSLNPGIDGKWHESMEGDPFYPHSNGYCSDDGNHGESSIRLDQMFVSAEACCDANYSYKSDCLTTSLNPPAADVEELPQEEPPKEELPKEPPTYISPQTELFLTESPSLFPTNAPTESPSLFPTNAPTESPSLFPTNAPVEELPKEEPPTYVSPQTEELFYPHYTIDGDSADCHNDGNAPSWISASMMTVDKFECCTTYFFSFWSDLCISDNNQHPYYPDYNNISCRNDGGQPSWMVGDYLTDYHVLCCDTHFGHNEDLLSGCKA